MIPSTTSGVAERKYRLSNDPPLHPHTDLHPWIHTLVFAPHPDDESLGCGGLISLLRTRKQRVGIVFVSDGAMSHPASKRYDYAARVALRRQEATEAAAELGVNPNELYFLNLPDTEVPRPHSPLYPAAVRQVTELLEKLSPSHVLVPWRRDPHCDHRATWDICREAVSGVGVAPRWVEYPIWMWNSQDPDDLPRPGEVLAWRLEVTDQLPQKARAIDCHRSQLTNLIDDDPSGFQLQEAMLANFRRPTELYFEPADKKYVSLTENYFNEVYEHSQDPWSFETSAYELAKYKASLAALPRDRYDNALEIGCSIGVLTARLAPRCTRLLSVDAVEAPLERARRRLVDYPSVRFERMSIPGEFPQATFDLIVVSEVGYYWSLEDLEIAIDKIRGALRPGGTLLLVHFTPYVPDYPLTGDEVHQAFETKLARGFCRIREARADRYRLDVYQRHGDAEIG